MMEMFEPVGPWTPEDVIGVVESAHMCVVLFDEQGVTAKQALEIGAIVLLEKPFVVLAIGGAKVPGLLADLSVAVLKYDELPDVDDEEFNRRIDEVATRVLGRLRENKKH